MKGFFGSARSYVIKSISFIRESAIQAMDTSLSICMTPYRWAKQSSEAMYYANEAFYQQMKVALPYAASVVVYRGVIKPSLYGIPGFKGSGFETTLDVVTSCALVRMAIYVNSQNKINQLLINANLAKNEEEKEGVVVPKECGCGHASSVTLADLNGGFCYVKQIVLSYAVSYLPYGEYFAPLLVMHAEGTALLESRYSVDQYCRKHRKESLSKNNVYALTLGAFLFLSVRLFVSHAPIKDAFYENAILNIFYPFFMAVALLEDASLPGKEPGIDVQKQVSAVYRVLAWIFLDTSFFSKEQFVKTPAVSLFFKNNKDMILKNIEAISHFRKKLRQVCGWLPVSQLNAIERFLESPLIKSVLAWGAELTEMATRSREAQDATSVKLEVSALKIEEGYVRQSDTHEQNGVVHSSPMLRERF